MNGPRTFLFTLAEPVKSDSFVVDPFCAVDIADEGEKCKVMFVDIISGKIDFAGFRIKVMMMGTTMGALPSEPELDKRGLLEPKVSCAVRLPNDQGCLPTLLKSATH